MKGILGRKIGMTSVFAKDGKLVPVTVIEVEPNIVSQIKTKEKDGYEAIHKTHIDLNENGTKAAAVTYFGMFKNTSIEPKEKEIINIEFNKPFIYIIRDPKTNEMLFFGVVYEPNKWIDSTCENVN